MEMKPEIKNPLRFVALVAVLTIVFTLCTSIATYRVSCMALTASVLWTAFLALYIKKHPFAWLMSLLMFVILAPMNVILYFKFPNHSHSQTGIFFIVVFWIGCVCYILCIRAAYDAYLRSGHSG
jgi:lysylphosphatidylglycerol synthetase-like protein (DUF2156 family)